VFQRTFADFNPSIGSEWGEKPSGERNVMKARKKKDQPYSVGLFILVEAAGIEPASEGLRLKASTCIAGV
jgi:hypothetical protein